MEILPGHGFAVFLIEPALRKAAERAGLEGDEFELCGIVVDNHAAVAGVGFSLMVTSTVTVWPGCPLTEESATVTGSAAKAAGKSMVRASTAQSSDASRFEIFFMG